MEPKCPSCGESGFSIIKREDQIFCYVCCDSCGCIVGVLEDIDFNKRYNKIIQNHGFFEAKIDEIQEKLDLILKKDKEISEQNQILLGETSAIRNRIK